MPTEMEVRLSEVIERILEGAKVEWRHEVSLLELTSQQLAEMTGVLDTSFPELKYTFGQEDEDDDETFYIEISW